MNIVFDFNTSLAALECSTSILNRINDKLDIVFPRLRELYTLRYKITLP